MRLIHNMASLSIYNEQNRSIKVNTKALNRIASGSKLNTASEGPNKIAQSEKMRMQIRGMQVAQRNLQDGVSLLQTAEGGLDSATTLIQRIKQLTIQAGGINTDADRTLIQNDIKQMINGVDDTIKDVTFNGIRPLGSDTVTNNDSPEYLIMTVGANQGEATKIPKYNLTSQYFGDVNTGEVLASIDVTTMEGVERSLKIVDKAMVMMLNIRSEYGALENRFESTADLSSTVSGYIERADSNIRDTDVAEEMMNFTRSNILIEVGNSLMAQTNKFPQEVLRILENVK